MKLAIMQPYFFPYIGYYQLVAAVDKFVFLDDANYQRGWMNRNRLLISGAVQYVTVPLSGASQNQKIFDVRVENTGPWREKMKRSVTQSYAKAPYFERVFALLGGVIDLQSDHLADYAKASIRSVAVHLGLGAEFVATSRDYANGDLTGQARILDIARREQASDYYNLPGGAALYDPATFQSNGMNLHFITPTLQPYPQAAREFYPGLSMLDVLMFTSKESVCDWLGASRQSV